ncbi:MAG TPA: hypothetical protein VMT20_17025 [Terriglobia bacterium]|nr:hypothetical protein [Terriglobia bacterium]
MTWTWIPQKKDGFVAQGTLLLRSLGIVTLAELTFLILVITKIGGGHMLAFALSDSGSGHSSFQTSESDRLYIVDTKGGAIGGGQVLVLDSTDNEVMKRIPTGLTPELALSPDGNTLFVISHPVPSQTDTLLLIDALTGNVRDRQAVSDRIHYTVWPEQPLMVVSPDGQRLYVASDRWTPSDEQKGLVQKDSFFVAIYGVQQRKFTSTVALPGDCFGMHLVPSPTALNVLCSSANAVFSYSVTSSGLGAPRSVALPPNPKQVFDVAPAAAATTRVHPEVAGAVVSPDGRILTVITSYMRAIQIDLTTERVERVEQVSDGRWAMPTALPISPDGAKVYIPTGPVARPNRALGADEITVLDRETLTPAATFHTTGPFWALTLSNDGHSLYAIYPKNQTLYVINTDNGQEVKKLTGLGINPSQVAVAP